MEPLLVFPEGKALELTWAELEGNSHHKHLLYLLAATQLEGTISDADLI